MGQVDSPETKLDELLPRKVKPNAMQSKKKSRQKGAECEIQDEDTPVEVELFSDVSDFNNTIPRKPSGKGSVNSRVDTKFNLDCYGMDNAPMNIFENQLIPVGIHNLSKSFRPNLNTIRVLFRGTKCIPKWDKTKTVNT